MARKSKGQNQPNRPNVQPPDQRIAGGGNGVWAIPQTPPEPSSKPAAERMGESAASSVRSAVDLSDPKNWLAARWGALTEQQLRTVALWACACFNTVKMPKIRINQDPFEVVYGWTKGNFPKYDENDVAMLYRSIFSTLGSHWRVRLVTLGENNE